MSRRTAMVGQLTPSGQLRSRTSSSAAITSPTSGPFSEVELVPNEKGAPCRTPLGRLQGLGSRCLVVASDSLIDLPAVVVSTASRKRRWGLDFKRARSPLRAAGPPARLALLSPELEGLSPAQFPTRFKQRELLIREQLSGGDLQELDKAFPAGRAKAQHLAVMDQPALFRGQGDTRCSPAHVSVSLASVNRQHPSTFPAHSTPSPSEQKNSRHCAGTASRISGLPALCAWAASESVPGPPPPQTTTARRWLKPPPGTSPAGAPCPRSNPGSGG